MFMLKESEAIFTRPRSIFLREKACSRWMKRRDCRYERDGREKGNMEKANIGSSKK